MQEKFRSSRIFLQRTDALAAVLGCLLKEIPQKIGISERAMFGYRSGKYPLTAKALRKLEAAERAAGIVFESESESDFGDGSPVVRDESYAIPNDYRSQSAQFSETERMMALLSRIADALETIVDRLPPPATLSEALGETRKQA